MAENKKVPASMLPGLRDEWMRALGAAQAAGAARQHAESLMGLYQSRMSGVLELLELDPNGQWQVDFRTGEVKLAPEGTNGMQAGNNILTGV
jgi:hypothetical protein